MGANVYLEDVQSYGYKTETTGTGIVQGIVEKSGKRTAIRAYGISPGTLTANAFFMQVLTATTTAAAIASGGSLALSLSATTSPVLASNDYIALKQDNGTTHFSKIATGTYQNFSLSTATTDTVAAGNTAWFFGASSDTGHFKIVLTASTQKTGALDGGIFYAPAKGYPMIAYHNNDAAGTDGSIDYVTVDYINK